MKLIILLLLLIPLSYGFDCSYFEQEKEICEEFENIEPNLIANMILPIKITPEHNTIKEVNDKLSIDDSNIQKTSKNYIKDSYLVISRVEPSIKLNNKLLVPKDTKIYHEYNYDIQIPNTYENSKKKAGRTCKKEYVELETTESLNQNKVQEIKLSNNKTINSILNIKTKIQEKIYKWKKSCTENSCKYKCKYYETNILEEEIQLEDSKELILHKPSQISSFEILDKYDTTLKGKLNNDKNTIISFDNSNLNNFNYEFKAELNQYHFLELKANEVNQTTHNNLISTNDNIYVQSENCEIKEIDLFETKSKPCEENIVKTQNTKFEHKPFDRSLNLLYLIGIFIAINFAIIKGIKKTFGKFFILALLLISIPNVNAAEECSIMDLSCLPEKFTNYFLNILNEPLEPLLNMVKGFLEIPPNIELFTYLWVIMVYIISMFYGLLIMYSGVMFLISGHNVAKREMAKEWLSNTIIMMVLIQASFLFYELVLLLGSSMTSGILSLVDENFFKITAFNLSALGLELLFVIVYGLVLFFTIILLSIRYLLLAMGVLFIPFGIFCYFVPPLRPYGKMILSSLGILTFVSVFMAIVILACSMLTSAPIFSEMKGLIMITCFIIVDYIFLSSLKLARLRSANSNGSKVALAIKYVTKVM